MKFPGPATYVLVTGAGSGLGKALVEVLHRRSISLAAFARTTPADVSGDGSVAGAAPLRYEQGDLGDTENMSAVLDRLLGEWGPPSLVVHNASVLKYRGPLWLEPGESVRETLSVNLIAPMLWVARLVPSMLQAGHGGHLFLSSAVGRQSRADWGAYAVSKSAVEVFSDNLSLELPAPLFSLTVNPGPIATKMRRKAYPVHDPASPRTATEAAGIFADFLPSLLGPAGRTFNGKKLDLEKMKELR